ncbi:YCF48-related protein [Pelomonas sp. Root1444]|uniref:WD40/YVTN/BNR-like repeat-containing protein n=1 Tax=Pelomonas sp. Root1444 TaxID=1736464 RepID=UPI000702CEA2|nr:YCF48-related protein [Pelomonas sp. Root1444]KQY82348.1 glycosyl hydrolase [Pelomonas sp. Root1444]
MKRLALLALACAAVAAQAAAPAPAALAEPALVSPKALGAATLAVARAGDRLVAAGERGTVLWSDDSGKAWQQAAVPVRAGLTTLRFVDAQNGWAAGHLGVILKTSDGGKTWTKQLDGLQAARAMLAAATDDAGRRVAQRFVDEGADKPWFDLDVIDARQAVAVGAYGLAMATRDGGASWQPLPTRAANPRGLHLYGVRVVAGQWFIAGEQGLLLRSSDGGVTFTPLASPYKGSFFGLLASHTGALLAYGLRGSVFRSGDAGANWDKVELGTPLTLQAGIERRGELTLLAQNGDAFTSSDDGRTFMRQPSPGGPLPAAGLAAAPDGAWVIASLRGTRRAQP